LLLPLLLFGDAVTFPAAAVVVVVVVTAVVIVVVLKMRFV
jgi:hypothetical protein